MKLVKAKNPQLKTANFLYKLIKHNLDKGKSVLLSISGGSNFEVYDLLGKKLIKENVAIEKLWVLMGDERWFDNPNHQNTNWFGFKQTSFFRVLKTNNAKIFNILKEKDAQLDASKLDQFLKNAFNKNFFTIASLGVGKDGHIAGIFPAPKSLFDKTYKVDSYVIAHKLDNQYKNRITTTPAYLFSVDEVVCFATSKNKEKILHKIQEKNNQYPNKTWEDNISKVPALFLSARESFLFTDFNYENN